MSSDLLLDGKTFISVGRASEQTGYTQDYLGQLCRSGKVSAKMVGRTWYLDHSDVLAHKQNPKSRKRNQIAAPPPSDMVNQYLKSQQASTYVSPFKFERDNSPTLPSLAKIPKKNNVVTKHNPKLLPFAIASLAVFACIAWVNLISPRATEMATNFLKTDVRSLSMLSAVTESVGTVSRTAAANGLVVFPDPIKHDAAVAQVENAFSDDATISFDKSGTSGVITPVFRTSTGSTSSYAFVMVPVNQSK